jgi:L-fuconolactonase
VLDHIAKPRIREGPLAPWCDHIRELAQAPNVCCKVSGLVTEADWANWKAEDFRPFLDIVFEAFDENRLMFGSDWPVCLLAGSYDRVFNLVEEYAQQLSAEGRAKFFGNNAARFYGISPPTD